MSNLIKSVYFNFDQKGTRVIDSDSQVEQFIPSIFQQQESELCATEEMALPLQQGDGSGSFQSGVNVLNMEEVRQEERAKVEQEASRQVEQLLADAKKEAENILMQAEEEARKLREQAQEEGRSQGIQEGRELARREMEQMQAEFQQQVEMQTKELDQQARDLEPKFADIMIALLEKITGILCQDKKEIIIYLIHQALYHLDKTKQISLRVSKEDILLVSSHKQELKDAVSEDVEFDILEDDSLKSMQCIIETDNKIIDCSLDVQLENLQNQIRMLTIL